jgi:hypothetical protein
MKVGDYVGWKTDDDGVPNEPVVPAGIILETRTRHEEWGDNYAEFLILLQHDGGLSWEFGSDLELIYESG